MTPVAGDSPAGAAYLALRRQARTRGRNTEELLQLYVLEGFLARLSASTLRERFVLKGGVLLAALDARRPTRDVDLAALDISNDADTVLRAVRAVLAIELPIDDGIAFEPETATSRVIREEDEYAGVRVNATARIATAHVVFHVDVNVGDPIWPAPVTVQVPRLLGGSPIEVRGYSLSMVHAEKIVTAVQRGTASTRWRDFGDVWTLALRYPIRGAELRGAIETVAAHRHAQLLPLRDVLADYPSVAQGKWAAWRRRSSLLDLPENFAEVLRTVIALADPVIDDGVADRDWNPLQSAWEPTLP